MKNTKPYRHLKSETSTRFLGEDFTYNSVQVKKEIEKLAEDITPKLIKPESFQF